MDELRDGPVNGVADVEIDFPSSVIGAQPESEIQAATANAADERAEATNAAAARSKRPLKLCAGSQYTAASCLQSLEDANVKEAAADEANAQEATADEATVKDATANATNAKGITADEATAKDATVDETNAKRTSAVLPEGAVEVNTLSAVSKAKLEALKKACHHARASAQAVVRSAQGHIQILEDAILQNNLVRAVSL